MVQSPSTDGQGGLQEYTLSALDTNVEIKRNVFSCTSEMFCFCVSGIIILAL